MELLCINPKGRPELEMLKVYHWDGEIVCPGCGANSYYLSEFEAESDKIKSGVCLDCNTPFTSSDRNSYFPERFVVINGTEMEHLEEELFCVPVKQQVL